MANSVSMYSDFAGLAQLREQARDDSPEAAREAAQQFEALFVQMMLQSMRSANAVLGEQRDTTYQDMFDRQIALELTRGKGLGIADLLLRQLALTGTDGTQSIAPGAFLEVGPERLQSAVSQLTQRRDWQPAGREEFVRDVLPHAEKAGRALGLDPRVLVAQAALETGWGQHVIRDSDGISSNNLFGIKATGNWTGLRLSIPTVEYADGVARRSREAFRVYDSLSEGFADYVRLIAGSERYAEAVSRAGDPDAYLDAIQAAGYATDPNYAGKIRTILHGPDLGDFVSRVKKSLPGADID